MSNTSNRIEETLSVSAAPTNRGSASHVDDISSGQSTGALAAPPTRDGRIDRFLVPLPPPVSPKYVEYASADDIDYTPEEALIAARCMSKAMKDTMQPLHVSKLRNEVWTKQFEEMLSQSLPSTLVAICGSTGAGKSSLINALLNDTIVPTSGMRACTSVVTEISYKAGSSIEAEILFLTADEWKTEIEELLDDLFEDGKIRRVSDLKSEAGIAWSKLHAVYPKITQDKLSKLNADEVVSYDPVVAQMLGSTRCIKAKNSKDFSNSLSPFIASNDTRQLGKVEKLALWPLIKNVKVRCAADVLSTGLVLVDLPGTADANAARSSIAAGYMQRCNCVWILAPITRAVDDKVARVDGNYDTSTITFIATKTDDILCREIISALDLEKTDGLREIDATIEGLRECESHEAWKRYQAESFQRLLGTKCDQVQAELNDTKQHLETIDQINHSSRVHSVAPLTEDPARPGMKRARSSCASSAKRRKSSPSSDHDMEVEPMRSKASGINSDQMDGGSTMDEVNKTEPESLASLNTDPKTSTQLGPDVLKERVDALEAKFRRLKDLVDEKKKEIQTAEMEQKRIGSKLDDAQRIKNAFCAIARNEYTSLALQADWRSGVRQLDEDKAMQEDPDNFDPDFEMRDYNKIELRTFEVSARDYNRLKLGKRRDDGNPTCFTNTTDTQVPAVREFGKSIPVPLRKEAAQKHLHGLNVFSASVRSYLRQMGSDTAVERTALRDIWFTSLPPLGSDSAESGSSNSSSMRDVLKERFSDLVKEVTQNLRHLFRSSLEDKLKVGSAAAATEAVNIFRTSLETMPWQTQRAVIRRDGVFGDLDLNYTLCFPMTRSIAQSWVEIFTQDLFAKFKKDALDIVRLTVLGLQTHAADPLKDRCAIQGEFALEHATATMSWIIEAVSSTLQREQKAISRCISPSIRNQLKKAYRIAHRVKGAGFAKCQKNILLDYIEEHKYSLFDGASTDLKKRLNHVAELIGRTLRESLDDLAREVEAEMSILWETTRLSPEQLRCRDRALEELGALSQQVRFWIVAADGDGPPETAV